MVRILLADDHEIVREGFALICAENGMRITAQCADGATALEMVLTHKPDLAILDLEMPRMTGAEVIRQSRLRGVTSKLLILSISREDSKVMDALRAVVAGEDACATQ